MIVINTALLGDISGIGKMQESLAKIETQEQITLEPEFVVQDENETTINFHGSTDNGDLKTWNVDFHTCLLDPKIQKQISKALGVSMDWEGGDGPIWYSVFRVSTEKYGQYQDEDK